MSDDPQYPSLPVSEVVNKARTGDVFLFQSHARESDWIRRVTGSGFSHTGMVALHPRDRKPMLWQTVPQQLGRDPETGAKHTGAQCGWLEATLEEMAAETYHSTPYWRPLEVERDSQFEEAVLNAIADLEGRPFPSLLRMVMEFLEGQLHIRSSGPDLYCAALVAVMYQRMGLLPAEDPPPNWYDPKRFSEEFDKLPMLRGRLGQTYYVDLASS